MLRLEANSLDEAFRIDIAQIDVVYDVDPQSEYVNGRSRMRFQMREGQVQPIFHFDPWTPFGRGRANSLLRVVLNGEEIPVEELISARMLGSEQNLFEIDRILVAGEHVLEFEWELWNWFKHEEPGWFRTVVDDSGGMGNETLWPTINSPDELARHTLEFRIHSDEPYSAVGSTGVDRDLESGVQVFKIDTGREVSSYTVMLCALPSDQVSEHSFMAGDVPVSMLSTLDEVATAQAVEITKGRLFSLAADFGELAQPSVDILLIDWDTGMEYFGATTTGLVALPHELTHLYWGTVAINSTWRDSWLDEAINVWWNYNSAPVADDFSSDLLSGSHSLALGFDDRAYEEGARVIGAVAAKLGVADAVEFLAGVYSERQFEPFSTDDFVADLVRFTGDQRWITRFERWVGNAQWAASR
ncbi:MAG: hypothetical protein ACPGSC_07585 [Granulosicoccaceae bacterium]